MLSGLPSVAFFFSIPYLVERGKTARLADRPLSGWTGGLSGLPPKTVEKKTLVLGTKGTVLNNLDHGARGIFHKAALGRGGAGTDSL